MRIHDDGESLYHAGVLRTDRAHDEERRCVCLHSTAVVDGERVSSIVGALPLGTPITTPRHHVQYIVTEHGVANLGMLTARERAEALIAIADPAFRAELRGA